MYKYVETDKCPLSCYQSANDLMVTHGLVHLIYAYHMDQMICGI